MTLLFHSLFRIFRSASGRLPSEDEQRQRDKEDLDSSVVLSGVNVSLVAVAESHSMRR